MKITSYNNLKTGDVLNRIVPFYWYKPQRYIASFIRFFTKSTVSHTAMIVDVWGEKMVIENDNGKTQLISFSNWAKDSEVIVTRDSSLTDTDKRLLCVIAINELGNTGYDYEAIPHHIIYAFSGIWIGRTGENAKSKKVCSELIAYLYDSVKKYYPEWYKTVPRDIYNDKRFEIVFKGKAKDLI